MGVFLGVEDWYFTRFVKYGKKMKFTCYLGQKRGGRVQDFWFDPKSQKMSLFYFAMTPNPVERLVENCNNPVKQPVEK